MVLHTDSPAVTVARGHVKVGFVGDRSGRYTAAFG
jgi:hypothetical protein